MTKAEEIYHSFVQYEWNEIGESMKKSILDAINEALRQPPVSGSLCGSFDPDNRTNSATKCKCDVKNGNIQSHAINVNEWCYTKEAIISTKVNAEYEF